jgi:hypothetical protein
LSNDIFISPQKYVAHNLLDNFKMTNCKQVTTPTSFCEEEVKDDGSNKVDPTI